MLDFENGWEEHQKKLKKYMLTQAKFPDWTQISVKEAQERQFIQGEFDGSDHFWYNQKTGEKTLQHPGKRYFQVNAKPMRQRAEALFQKDVLDGIENEKAKLADRVHR